MPSQQFLWKPTSESDGRLVVLLPNRYTGKTKKVNVVLPDGRRVSGRFTGDQKNGQRGHYRFSQPGQAFPKGSYVEAELEGGGKVQWGVGNPSSRNVGGLGASGRTSEIPEGGTSSLEGQQVSSGQTGGGGGTGTGNNVEFAEGDPGFAFPQSDFSGLEFTPINPSFIPQVDVPFVDPLEAAERFGDFNIEQFQENLQTGGANALGLLELEFTGLQAFNRAARQLQQEGIIDENAFNQLQVAAANEFNRGEIPAANEFNRGEIAEANQFNQAQRIGQLEEALPGARDVINRQIERGSTLAEGRFTSDLEDRAFEAAARNASADQTVVRGFGDDSVFGRRASDLLSAEQRLQVSQVGEQTLDRFLSLGANLAFDQPIKFNPIIDQPLRFTPQQATTASDVRGAPARPASELAVQQQGALNQLTTITPAQGIQVEVGQNQFQAGLDQRTNEFNSQLDFNSQAFNSDTGLKVDLEKLYAETFNAQQEANAINQGISTEIAQQGFEAGQDLSTFGAIGEAVSTAAGIVSGVKEITSLFRGGGGASVAGEAGAGAGAAAALSPTSAGAGAGTGAGVGAGTGAGVGTGTGAGAGASGTVSVGGGGVSAASVPTAASIGGETAGVVSAGGAGAGAAGVGAASTVSGTGGAGAGATGAVSVTGAELSGATGAGAASAVPVSTIAGAAGAVAVGATAGYLIADAVFGSGKSGAQKSRDSLRNHGEDLGVFTKGEDISGVEGLTEDHHYVQLSDGSYYDIGLDGGHKLSNYSTNVDGETERHTFQVDWSDPRAGQVVGYLNPAATILFGQNGHKMVGHLWNAATSNNGTLSESKDNVRHMVEQAGIDYETGVRILKKLRDFRAPAPEKKPIRDPETGKPRIGKSPVDYSQRGIITEEEYNAYLNGWNELMRTENVPQEISV